MQLLIVEDQQNDIRVAAAVAKESGFSDVEAATSIAAARAFLEKSLNKTQPPPDAILLDLDLGYESGFELLRFWHGDPELSKIPVLVWTILGDHYRDICGMFKVSAYIDKSTGATALRQVLGELTRIAS